MLAKVLALQTWRHYSMGIAIVVRTSHRALVRYLNKQLPKLQQRELSWLPQLADFQLTIVYKPGKLNLPPDALSRRRCALHLTVLDSCAGTGTIIRSLAHTVPSHVRMNCIAMENSPDCRMVVERVLNLVQRNHRGLYMRKDIFHLGSDVKDLIDRRLPIVDLIIAGVPCQPFSKANPAGKGLGDERSLFQTVHKVIMYTKTTFYAIECTLFAQHLQSDLDEF